MVAAAAADADGSPRALPEITHVCFDMDGLLLDTEACYTVAQRKVLDEIEPGLGEAFTWELKSKMMGRTSLAAGQVLVDELDLEKKYNIGAAEFVKRREEALAVLLPDADAMPGAKRLVEHLKKNGIPAAVATSSHREHFELKTQKHGEMFSKFEHVVTGCQVTKGKPAPEIFQVCAAAFSEKPASPSNVLVFEDAPIGVEAALAAGMRCVFVPDEKTPKSEAHEKACSVLRSLEEFDPEAWGLPPFSSDS